MHKHGSHMLILVLTVMLIYACVVRVNQPYTYKQLVSACGSPQLMYTLYFSWKVWLMPTIFSVYSQLCDEIDEHDKKIPAEIIETDSDTKKKIPGEVWSPSALGQFTLAKKGKKITNVNIVLLEFALEGINNCSWHLNIHTGQWFYSSKIFGMLSFHSV